MHGLGLALLTPACYCSRAHSLRHLACPSHPPATHPPAVAPAGAVPHLPRVARCAQARCLGCRTGAGGGAAGTGRADGGSGALSGGEDQFHTCAAAPQPASCSRACLGRCVPCCAHSLHNCAPLFRPPPAAACRSSSRAQLPDPAAPAESGVCAARCRAAGSAGEVVAVCGCQRWRLLPLLLPKRPVPLLWLRMRRHSPLACALRNCANAHRPAAAQALTRLTALSLEGNHISTLPEGRYLTGEAAAHAGSLWLLQLQLCLRDAQGGQAQGDSPSCTCLGAPRMATPLAATKRHACWLLPAPALACPQACSASAWPTMRLQSCQMGWRRAAGALPGADAAASLRLHGLLALQSLLAWGTAVQPVLARPALVIAPSLRFPPTFARPAHTPRAACVT